MGHGNIGYGHVNSTHYQTGAQIGSCFDCLGRGTMTVRVSSIKARLRRETKRADEAAKAQAEADAGVLERPLKGGLLRDVQRSLSSVVTVSLTVPSLAV